MMKPITIISQITTKKTFVYKSILTVTVLLIVNVFLVSNSFAQIALRGAATTGSNAGNNLTINKPTGVVSGDVMIVNICKYPNNNTPVLAGWTLIAGPASLGGTNYSYLLYRVADGTEGASFTFALGTTTYGAGAIVAFSGVDITGGFLVGGGAGGPFDVAPGSISIGTTSPLSVTPITTNSANAGVVMFGMNGSATPRTFTTWSTTSPGTLSEIYDYNGATFIEVGAAWGTKTTAGTTGPTSSLTLSGSSNIGAMLIALKKFICPAITTTAEYNSPVCIGATINLTATNASGGTSPYTYSWSGPNSYGSTSQNSTIANSITSMNGTYTVTATDSKGCTGSSNVAVTVNPIPLSSVTGQANITCNAANDGTITVTASGGTSPYMFSVDNGADYQAATGTDLSLFTGLHPDTPYRIKVKDANGCISK